MDAFLENIGDTLAALQSGQATQLLSYLKNAHNIEPNSAGVALVIPEDPIHDREPVIEKQVFFDLVLTGITDLTKKIGVIKTVREITGLGLKECKETVEAVPKVLKESLLKEDAEKLKATLEAVGGVVELR